MASAWDSWNTHPGIPEPSHECYYLDPMLCWGNYIKVLQVTDPGKPRLPAVRAKALDV